MWRQKTEKQMFTKRRKEKKEEKTMQKRKKEKKTKKNERCIQKKKECAHRESNPALLVGNEKS